MVTLLDGSPSRTTRWLRRTHWARAGRCCIRADEVQRRSAGAEVLVTSGYRSRLLGLAGGQDWRHWWRLRLDLHAGRVLARSPGGLEVGLRTAATTRAGAPPLRQPLLRQAVPSLPWQPR